MVLLGRLDPARGLQVVVAGVFLSIAPAGLCQDSNGTVKNLAPSPALSSKGNVDYYLKHTYGPGAIVGSAFWSGIQQWRDTPHEWGQGADGYGRRLGSAQGRRIIANTVDLGFASLRGEILEYPRCQCSGFLARTRHALKYTALRQTDAGGTTLAVGRFAGAYASALIANTWYPDSRNSVGDGLVRGTTTLGIGATKNLLREFWPDIKKKVLHR